MLDKIPKDVFMIIMDFARLCKKDNLFISKQLFNQLKPCIEKCEPIIVFRKSICMKSHKKAIDAIKSFQYLV